MNSVTASVPSTPRREIPRLPQLPEGWLHGVVAAHGERLVAISCIGADWKDPTGWSFLLGSFNRRQ